MPSRQPHEQTYDERLTSSQVARLLGVSTRTVQRMETRGDLTPARLPSGHRRYLRSEIEALLVPERVR